MFLKNSHSPVRIVAMWKWRDWRSCGNPVENLRFLPLPENTPIGFPPGFHNRFENSFMLTPQLSLVSPWEGASNSPLDNPALSTQMQTGVQQHPNYPTSLSLTTGFPHSHKACYHQFFWNEWKETAHHPCHVVENLSDGGTLIVTVGGGPFLNRTYRIQRWRR